MPLFLIQGIALSAPQPFRIDIDTRQISSSDATGNITTELGWTSFNTTAGNGSIVVIDGVFFRIDSIDDSRTRSGGTSDLTRDFVFDDGADQEVRLELGTSGQFPEGRWRARVWIWDAGLSSFGTGVNLMTVGWSSSPGVDHIVDKQVAPHPTDPAIEFTFYADGSPGHSLFVRENNDFDRSRLNAVELTRLDVGREESGAFALDTRNFVNTSPFPVDTRHPDVVANTGILHLGVGSTTITMDMLQVTGGPDAMDDIIFTLVSAPRYGTLLLDGTPLVAGATFTQGQIGAGLLVHRREEGTPALTEVIELSAVDEAGRGLAAGSLFFVVGTPGEGSSGLVLVDTRNYTESGTHIVHTDTRAYVTSDAAPGSLRQAISNASKGKTVDFDAALDGETLFLADGPLRIVDDMVVDASTLAAGGISLSGDGLSRVMDVAASATVTLNSLDVTGGNSSFGGLIRNAGTLRIENSTLSEGTSNVGGGIYNDPSGRLSLVNTTLAGNVATESGGGVFNGGRLTLNHVTMTANTATRSGGGIYNEVGSSLTLVNSILADNLAANGPDLHNLSTPPFLAGVNLLSDLSGSTLSVGSSLLVGPARLAPLADYGGGTPTRPPLPGSPIIENAVWLDGSPATDQRGAPRPLGPLPDIGAVEAFAYATLGLIDTDGDGIDDRLESAYGLVVGSDDSQVDSDGDGSSDGEEIINMTDPNDPNDRFRILSFAPAAGFDADVNPVFDITLRTFPGLNYALESSDSLESFQSISESTFTATNHAHTLKRVLAAHRAFVRAYRGTEAAD